jgi:dihydropteroate synthase
MAEPGSARLTLRCGRFSLTLGKPLVMGIVNVTPDSFSDGGRYLAVDAAIAHARRLLEEGADILDIGGESTRPGAQPVGDAEEIARISPVLEAMRESGVPLSVDTRHAGVMRAALALGADMINDVDAFRDSGAIEAVAGSPAGLCVMHMLGEPSTMQQSPVYRDVVAEVTQFLEQRVMALTRAGVARDRIVLDPGIGFGKTQEDNLRLLREPAALLGIGLPVLIGLSRKSLIGHLTGRPVEGRLAGSLGGAIAAAASGAAILRVHDVAATRDALAVWQAIHVD